jgi:hypothetical protein
VLVKDDSSWTALLGALIWQIMIRGVWVLWLMIRLILLSLRTEVRLVFRLVRRLPSVLA